MPMRSITQLFAACLLAVVGADSSAQIAPLADVKAFVQYDQPLIAITHAKLVDGTGAPAKLDWTIVIRSGRIAQAGPATQIAPPKEAFIIDARDKTVLPGFVMMHEHMFYPTGPYQYTEMLRSFPPLYVAGGTTTLRTAGTTSPDADLNLRDGIARGEIFGPDMHVTAPYLNGPGMPILKMRALTGADDAERTVNFWADKGVTSYKAYTNVTRAELRRIIQTAHRRGHKVTAHLCSATYREAADMGIDNLEHGFGVMTDFTPGKKPDICPDYQLVAKSIADLDVASPQVRDLIHLLVRKRVALTSTLAVFETLTPGRPHAPERALSVLIAPVREQYEIRWKKVQAANSPYREALPKLMRLEHMFVAAGGLLMSGTDPTGYGGVIPGFAGKRQIELLVEAGFSFEDAIRISTLNGAKFLNRERDVGTVEVGKRADMILVEGDPSQDTAAIANIRTVFKEGIGYRSDAIIDSMKDAVGLN